MATSHGNAEHKKMENIVVDDNVGDSGDENTVKIIRSRPDLKPYFDANSKTEVGIAGEIDGEFKSKRIDRLCINHDKKEIVFIDYKTDEDKTVFIEEYKKQLKGYKILLADAYPDYNITGYILWLKYWDFEQIV